MDGILNTIDSITVEWPGLNNKKTILTNVGVNQFLEIRQ